MLWVVLGFGLLALVFFQMGVYSVWISAVKSLLALVFMLSGVWLVYFLWRKLFPRKC